MSTFEQVNAKVKSEPLPCPGAQTVKESLQHLPAGVEALIYSVAELADKRQAKELQVYVDERQHPCQSLLNPLLSDCQGAALCFSIPGQLLLPAVAGQPCHRDIRSSPHKILLHPGTGFPFFSYLQI